MAGRARCARPPGRDEMGGLWYLRAPPKRAGTPTIPFPHTLSDQSQSTQIFSDVSRLFFLHSGAGFTFSPGQSCRLFAGEIVEIPRQAFATKQQFQLLDKFPTLCTHQRSQGPLVKAPHLKEKCQTLRTSYFIK